MPVLAGSLADSFCSVLAKILEFKETTLFPSGNSWTKIEPVPTLDESTCIWKG